MILIERNRNDENGVAIQPNTAWFTASDEAKRTAINEKENHKADGTASIPWTV